MELEAVADVPKYTVYKKYTLWCWENNIMNSLRPSDAYMRR